MSRCARAPVEEAATVRAVAVLVVLMLVAPVATALGLQPITREPEPQQDDCGTGGDIGGDEGTAHQLLAGQRCSGTFGTGTDVDRFRFHADAGQFVRFTSDDDWDRGEMTACAYGPARDRGCYMVAYQHIEDSFVALSTGEYGYEHYGSGPGYRWNASLEIYGETAAQAHDDCGTGTNGGNGWETATPLVAPVDCVGILEGADAWDLYTFHAYRGQDVEVRLDVADDVDHEVCLYSPAWYDEDQCSTLPAGADETIRFEDAAETGTWSLSVYRYSGDGAYGLGIDVTGEPGNEDPRPGITCPEIVDVDTPFLCTFFAIDDSDAVRYRIYWGSEVSERVPADGSFVPTGDVLGATHVFDETGYEAVRLRVEDDGGRVGWTERWLYVRPPKDPHQDCGLAVDAGDTADLASAIPVPLVHCAGALVDHGGADGEDWYAVEVPPGSTLHARIDEGSGYPELCAFDPTGMPRGCGEIAIADPLPGVWRLRLTREYTWELRNATYQLSIATRAADSAHTAVGAVPGLGPDAPLPGLDGIDGAWIDVDAWARAYRLRSDEWRPYVAWYYDGDGQLIERSAGEAVPEYALEYTAWTAFPAGTSRMFVQLSRPVGTELPGFEARLYG